MSLSLGAAALAIAALAVAALASPALAASPPTVYAATGAQQVAGAISGFEAAVGGTDNGAADGPLASGFRSLNWDGVGAGVYSAQRSISPQGGVDPSGLDALNFLIANRRGLQIGTAGTGVEVSGDGFRELNPAYPALFASPNHANAFAPLGATETDMTFEVPDSYASLWSPDPPGVGRGNSPGSKATVSGLGVVFMNVEAPGTSSIEYLAADGRSLGTYDAPVGPQSAREFVGVVFDEAPVAAVRIVSGTVPLSAGVNDDGGQNNVVALGNFVASEPVPGPSVTIAPFVVSPGLPVTITGTVNDPIGIPSVAVAGSSATVSADGVWTTTLEHLDLDPGRAVSVIATDSRGLSTTAETYPEVEQSPGPGTSVAPTCRVALAPAVITIAKHRPTHDRTAQVTGRLTVRATCASALRGVITAALTATATHRRRSPSRTFVVRSHPVALAAGSPDRVVLIIQRGLASQLTDRPSRVAARVTLRGVGAKRAAATAVIHRVAVVRQHSELGPRHRSPGR